LPVETLGEAFSYGWRARRRVDRSLIKVLRRWRQICFQTMRTTIVSQTSSYIAPVLPIILCAPKFLDGTMSLGQVMQAASAFTIDADRTPRRRRWRLQGRDARRYSSRC
jgi:ABC-type uncharacterized transport system fused permease/ATPase subunit